MRPSFHVTWFSHGLENLEKWEGVFQSGEYVGILNKLQILGKSQGTLHKILKDSGNFRKMLFVIFSDIEMNYVLFAKMDKVFS